MDILFFLLAMVGVYVAYRIIRGGFDRPQSERWNVPTAALARPQAVAPLTSPAPASSPTRTTSRAGSSRRSFPATMKATTQLPAAGRRGAFTLIELLVVVAIIGILAAVGIPAITGLTSSNRSAVATGQLAGDLKLARNRAIAERTTVYVAFVPTNFTDVTLAPTGPTSTAADVALRNRNIRLIEKLLNQKYVSYALYADRRVGDQPGRPSAKYLTSWKSLPEGSFIAAREFDRLPSAQAWKNTPIGDRPLPYGQFPFPSDTADAPLVAMPYIAFNHLGQMVTPTYFAPGLDPNQPVPGLPEDEIIRVAQGSIFPARNGSTGKLVNEAVGEPFSPADLTEVPADSSANQWVRVNWLTGRAQIDRPQIVD